MTKFPLIRRGVYLSLYVVLDLFSRYIVSWMLSHKENSALARQLMDESVGRYQIAPGQLTLHQDRGSPMTTPLARARLKPKNTNRTILAVSMTSTLLASGPRSMCPGTTRNTITAG
jgi:transposase InsO family protein